ncbi:MAG: hypothetical protein WBC51_28240 [Vicinamibacterales bacterium]
MKCPSCGSARVYPSRLRNVVERLRQNLTDKQPFRCHECGWRQWRELVVHEAATPVEPDDLRTGRAGAPLSSKDLEQLDSTPRRP